MNATVPLERPRWLRDLLRFLPLKSQFVLSGNVRDLQFAEPRPGFGPTTVPLLQCLTSELGQAGYTRVIAYNPVRGFSVALMPGERQAAETEAVLRELGLQSAGGFAPAGLEQFAQTLERIAAAGDKVTAVIADFASQLVMRPDVLTPIEHQAFTRALVLGHGARPIRPPSAMRPLFNTVIWLVDKEGDLPDWLVIDNPRLRHIPVAKPDRGTRRTLVMQLVASLKGHKEADGDTITIAIDRFVDETEGLLLLDLVAIRQLGREEGIDITHVADAVRRYKVGVTEDPGPRSTAPKSAAVKTSSAGGSRARSTRSPTCSTSSSGR